MNSSSEKVDRLDGVETVENGKSPDVSAPEFTEEERAIEKR